MSDLLLNKSPALFLESSQSLGITIHYTLYAFRNRQLWRGLKVPPGQHKNIKGNVALATDKDNSLMIKTDPITMHK